MDFPFVTLGHRVVMTTFYYYSVNHQSGLLKNTFFKIIKYFFKTLKYAAKYVI